VSQESRRNCRGERDIGDRRFLPWNADPPPGSTQPATNPRRPAVPGGLIPAASTRGQSASSPVEPTMPRIHRRQLPTGDGPSRFHIGKMGPPARRPALPEKSRRRGRDLRMPGNSPRRRRNLAPPGRSPPCQGNCRAPMIISDIQTSPKCRLGSSLMRRRAKGVMGGASSIVFHHPCRKALLPERRRIARDRGCPPPGASCPTRLSSHPSPSELLGSGFTRHSALASSTGRRRPGMLPVIWQVPHLLRPSNGTAWSTRTPMGRHFDDRIPSRQQGRIPAAQLPAGTFSSSGIVSS
jgi:hypothetical protein